MNAVERAVRKFRESPSPVVMTPEEHLALCSHYGAIKPNDYENPFMGKIIDVRTPEFPLLDAAPLEDDGFELPIDTFIPPAETDPEILPPLADDLDAHARYFPADEEDPDQEIAEDPNA